MKIEENVLMCKLFDAYGALLSQTQREVIGDFLLYDLTGSEIALNRNISRQAVKDTISKAVAKLEHFENLLHFVEKFELVTKENERLKNQTKRREE